MALRYALLAALHKHPATGYELTQRFRTRLTHVWNASHQQIYRELARLDSDQLVVAEAVVQQARPDKKRYQLTIAGKHALEAWLNRPHPLPAQRDPLQVKLIAGDLLTPEALAESLASLREECVATLGYYRVIEHAYFRQTGDASMAHRFQHLALRRGMLDLEATLTWLDEAASVLDQHEPGTATASATAGAGNVVRKPITAQSR
ncbi:MAG: PadR family transcriptional regulator [Marinobacter sp.]|nr:PadR family transcriptional regulator [Marinobacter sp.]